MLLSFFQQVAFLLLLLGCLSRFNPISHDPSNSVITLYSVPSLPTSICTSQPVNNNTVIGAANCRNNDYIGTLGIGSPAQNFTMTFDTGSNILWIPTTSCFNCSNKQFNTQSSATFQTTTNSMSIQYADGSGVYGYYGSDVVSFAGTPINVSTGILWVSAEQDMDNIYSNGLIGLGYDPGVDNFFDSAYKAGQINTSAFAVNLMLNEFNSYFYYNNLPDFITSSTVYVDQYGAGHWQAQTIGFYADGIDLTSYASSASIIDSGTSYFYFNTLLYNQIILQFFSGCTLYSNYIKCPCDTNFPTFTFYFVGIKTYLYPENYTNSCNAFFGSIGSDVGSILLGDTFMRNYIVTFDKKHAKLGFSGNMGIVYLIGQGATQFFYISQIVALGLAVFFLILLLIVCLFVNRRTKAPSRALNTFLMEVP